MCEVEDRIIAYEDHSKKNSHNHNVHDINNVLHKVLDRSYSQQNESEFS